ncbi:MAG: VOC family protein [Bifidobacterium sp.]|nr:VOC family protein [Bifidobacterium sp.]
MSVPRVDHIVIPVSDLEASITFYRDAVGLNLLDTNKEATLATLRAGEQLVKLETPNRQGLVAAQVVPGSADLCFQSDTEPEATLARMRSLGVRVVAGPVEKQGPQGVMVSVYVRDPDGSLVEIAHYPNR